MPTRRFFVVAAALAALCHPPGLATMVAAGPPLVGVGTSTLTSSDIVSVRQAGGNTFIEQHNTRADTGAFVGNVDEHLSLVVHPNGRITFHADAILDGVYPACGPDPVTQSITLSGQITPDGELRANFATTKGAAVIVQGTVAGSADSPTANFEIAYHC